MLNRFLHLLLWREPRGIDITEAIRQKEAALPLKDRAAWVRTALHCLRRKVISTAISRGIATGFILLAILQIFNHVQIFETISLPYIIILAAVSLIERCAANKATQELYHLLNIKI